ncbi:MAG: TatD family hydrolase, partial [Spirosomaceae bacterium]|nr:TatD family hydrolase [Spirosomataceae bacterium]
MLLNIHTHHRIKQDGEQIIFNQTIPCGEENIDNFGLESETEPISLGIHPWFIDELNYQLQLDKLAELSKSQLVRLIGECGLDRLKGPNLQLQEEVFIKQIRIAEDLRKSVIIHCVRCFSELVSIKKIIRPKVPMIVHGFNQNEQIAKQLIEKGFYLSIGAAVLEDDSNAAKVVSEIPLNQLFIETDDVEISIKSVYEKIASIKKMAVEEL